MKKLLLGVAVGFTFIWMAIRWVAEKQEELPREPEQPTIH